MAAGDSARQESLRQLELQRQHEAAAAEAARQSRNYAAASQSEKRTAGALAKLAAVGYYLLADRAWPGSRRAQVDLVVLGPTGLFIVDTKAWSEVTIDQHHLYRGQEDASDELAKLESLLDATQSALVEVGLPPGEVHALMVFAGLRNVNERLGQIELLGEHDVLRRIVAGGERLSTAEIDAVLVKALEVFPPVGQVAPVRAAVVEPVIPLPKPQAAEIDLDALFPESEVEQALLSSLLEEPIERWMCFLHPTQAKQIKRKFSGPSRIRGAAGTGKTVVGLHRAAYLARTRPHHKVLFTSYVRTLPVVLENLFAQMAPDVADRVDFLPVHKFARRVLSDRGVRCRVDPAAVENAFARAWLELRGTSPEFAEVVTLGYLKDEVSKVLKARGITRFEDYAALARLGRKQRLNTVQRQIVWQFYSTYSTYLSAAGCHDWDDLIALARAELTREPLEEYGAVVVDEVQDLTAESLGMLHTLVGDAPDGLTLIGDTEQSIYPGGFKLSEVGISVTGRSVVLDVNYRNTREILNFARQAIAGDDVSDIEDSSDETPQSPVESAAARIISANRTGSTPEIVYYSKDQDWAELMVSRIQAVTAELGTALGDVAVLVETNRKVDEVAAVLRRAGLPPINLVDYDGTPTDQIKIGTVKRAKGLEFKQVLLPDVRGVLLGERAEDDERDVLARRELYVAMTRARDGLWVGVRG